MISKEEKLNYKKTAAIILAAGKGTRFGGKKQFISLHGKYLYQHVLEKASDCIDIGNIVTVGVDIPGGSTRSESVRMGLKALPSDTSRVVILEAARPLVTREQIQILIEDSWPSTSFVIPLVNTVVSRSGFYVDRSQYYDLLTPQAFNFSLLNKAYETGKYLDMTDETRVMYEEYNIKANFIETGDNLVKVTYPRDVAVIESLIKERGDLL